MKFVRQFVYAVSYLLLAPTRWILRGPGDCRIQEDLREFHNRQKNEEDNFSSFTTKVWKRRSQSSSAVTSEVRRRPSPPITVSNCGVNNRFKGDHLTHPNPKTRSVKRNRNPHMTVCRCRYPQTLRLILSLILEFSTFVQFVEVNPLMQPEIFHEMYYHFVKAGQLPRPPWDKKRFIVEKLIYSA